MRSSPNITSWNTLQPRLRWLARWRARKQSSGQEKKAFPGWSLCSRMARVWLPFWTNLRKSDRTSCRNVAKRGGAMSKMVIEGRDQFVEVGKAMAEHLAMRQRTVDRLGGGKAVDYAAVEAAIAEGASRTELAAHGAILKSLDIDVPAVVIGGVRYTRVGRCEGAYHTMIGSVSVERSLYRQSGERGGQPGGRVVVAVDSTGDELCGAARHVAGSASDGAGVWAAAVVAGEFRAGGAPGRCTGG